MNKHLTTPHERNSRTEHPIGILGIPPPEDKPRPIRYAVFDDVVVIVADRDTAYDLLRNLPPNRMTLLQ